MSKTTQRFSSAIPPSYDRQDRLSRGGSEKIKPGTDAQVDMYLYLLYHRLPVLSRGKIQRYLIPGLSEILKTFEGGSSEVVVVARPGVLSYKNLLIHPKITMGFYYRREKMVCTIYQGIKIIKYENILHSLSKQLNSRDFTPCCLIVLLSFNQSILIAISWLQSRFRLRISSSDRSVL